MRLERGWHHREDSRGQFRAMLLRELLNRFWSVAAIRNHNGPDFNAIKRGVLNDVVHRGSIA